MTKQRIPAFENACQDGYAWLNAISRELNHPSRVLAHHALRGVLHALRDRLPVNEMHHLGAQLPLLIRGIYFEGYRPSGKPMKMHRDEFLHLVSHELQHGGGANPEAAVRAVFAVVAAPITPGELDHVLQALPGDLRALMAPAAVAT
jgi:uncharacterized protein (DUF2267 family)